MVVFLFCLYRLNTFTTTSRQSRVVCSVFWLSSTDASVEGLKKIMSYFRSVVLNFFTAEIPLRKWAVNCVLLFSPSIAAFCPESVPFHSPNSLRTSPPVPYQENARSFLLQPMGLWQQHCPRGKAYASL